MILHEEEIQDLESFSGYRFCNNITTIDKEEWIEKEIRIINQAQRFSGLVYAKIPNRNRKICLTFDDSPDKKNTPKVLDILKEHEIKATFFVLGKRVPRYSDLVRRMADEGHYIGIHTQNHYDLTLLSNEEIRSEIMISSQNIKKAIGKVPTFFRPPYGALDDRVIQVLRDMGMKIILWSVNTCDWLERKPENIIHNVTRHTNNGDIILLHSYVGKEPTVKALPEIIKILKAKKYEFATVEQLLTASGYLPQK